MWRTRDGNVIDTMEDPSVWDCGCDQIVVRVWSKLQSEEFADVSLGEEGSRSGTATKLRLRGRSTTKRPVTHAMDASQPATTSVG